MMGFVVAVLVALLGQPAQQCVERSYSSASYTSVMEGDVVTIATNDSATAFLLNVDYETVYYTTISNETRTIVMPEAGTLEVEAFRDKIPSAYTLVHCFVSETQPTTTMPLALVLSSIVPFVIVLLIILAVGTMLARIVK